MKKIGLLGGTFNPIHIGHLILAESAIDAANLDEVWFVPTGVSYLKNKYLPAKERLKMVQMAISNNPHFKCCDIEVFREGNTYTYETLESLKEHDKENQYFFITGADCLYTIEEWKYPERIFKNCTLLIATRENSSMEEMNQKKNELVEKFKADIIIFPFLNLSLSSTKIRENIKTNQSIRYMVPESVREYIYEKRFYCD